MTQFSPLTQAHLGYYVYALAYPNGGKIFYIGKGQNNRVFDHARAALQPSIITPNDKIKVIKNILSKGKEPDILIFRHGLTEKEALIVESVLIDLYTNKLTRHIVKGKLLNRQGGHGMRELGIRTANELDAQYGNTPLGNVSDKLIVININKTYKNRSIYDATRSSWNLNKGRADKADFILSEYKGVIRAVFKMDNKKWQLVPTLPGKRRRYYFTGVEVDNPAICSRFINKTITKQKGQSNPILYINL